MRREVTERHKQQQREWHKRNDPGPGVIGEVKPLAPGAINPMWAIEAGLEPFLEAHPELYAPPKKKMKEAKPHSWDFPQTLKKPVDIDNEEDVVN